jgi:hypothetical protein
MPGEDLGKSMMEERVSKMGWDIFSGEEEHGSSGGRGGDRGSGGGI